MEEGGSSLAGGDTAKIPAGGKRGLKREKSNGKILSSFCGRGKTSGIISVRKNWTEGGDWEKNWKVRFADTISG